MPNLRTFSASNGATMKAVIIYDNLVFAEKAKAALQRAAQDADATAQLDTKLWRVDSLEISRIADKVLLEATDAHLIVFAGRRTQSLPAWLKFWLERWVEARQIKEAALAAIGGTSGDALVVSVEPALSNFVEKHGLDFIIDDSALAGEKEISPVKRSPEPDLPLVLVQAHTMEGRTYASSRGWGIND